jgi:hypothetical protein
MNKYYDSTHYHNWRKQRLDLIIDHYGKDYFVGKTVLELGAAWGHIGAFFKNELGAEVMCSDHYNKWVEIIRERYPDIPTITLNANDIIDEESWPCMMDFDVILHMGLLYHQPAHLAEPTLKEFCRHCTDIIVESPVEVNNSDPYFVGRKPRPPEKDLWETVATEYCSPSATFVGRILEESGMKYREVYYNGNRVMWFAQLNNGVNNG